MCVTSSSMPMVKWFFGSALCQLVEDALDHRRRELLGGQAVAPADDAGAGAGAGAGGSSDSAQSASLQGGDDVLVQRLADAAGLLGAVEHGDRAGRSAAAHAGSARRRTAGTAAP